MLKKDAMNLYEISSEIEELDALLDESGGEITEEIEAQQNRVFDLLQSKTDGMAGYVQYLNDLIASAKEKKDSLDKFIKQKQNRIERLSEYVLICLSKSKIEKFQGELYEIKTKKPTQVLFIKDESLVPLEYITSKRVVSTDKPKLKADVKAGKVNIEGIQLVDGKKSVSFKLKTETRKKRELKNE